MEAREQCVASFGVRSKVATTTSSTSSSEILRRTGARLVRQTVQARLEETPAPLAHRLRPDPEFSGHLLVRLSLLHLAGRSVAPVAEVLPQPFRLALEHPGGRADHVPTSWQ
jgi:hypothetical protein